MTMPAAPDPQPVAEAAADAVHGAATEATKTVESGVGQAAKSISAAVGKAADTAGDALRAAREGVSGRVQQAGQAADKLATAAIETVKRYPIRTVLIVAGAVAVAGFVVGALAARRA